MASARKSAIRLHASYGFCLDVLCAAVEFPFCRKIPEPRSFFRVSLIRQEFIEI